MNPNDVVNAFIAALKAPNSELMSLVTKAAKNGSRQGIGVEQAEGRLPDYAGINKLIADAQVLTIPMFAGGQGNFQVYQQLINTSYTGAIGAIKDSGLVGTPLPPPAPGPVSPAQDAPSA